VPIKSNKLGPGTLTLGELATVVDFSAQLASCVVKWNHAQEDAVPVVSGEELEGDETWSATISGNLIVDLSDDGIVEYTWGNKGAVVPFTFVPDSAAQKAISGQVKIKPLDVGGDAKKTMRSDFEWACRGEPTLGADLL
jgi:hypothetical protein